MSKKDYKKEEVEEKEVEEPSKKELTHPPKQKLAEPHTINKGTSIEQTKTEDPKSAILEEDLSDDKKREARIQEIKEKMLWNQSHDKSEAKEVTLAEENLVYGNIQE